MDSIMTDTASIQGLGAVPLGDDNCLFRVWSPFADRVEVNIPGKHARALPLSKTARGYHEGVFDNVPPGTQYMFQIDDETELPDPASRYQPEGVHGASAVVKTAFDWTDHSFRGIPLKDFIIYELHTGTYTAGGTFTDIIPHLKELCDLGVTAIELMPVAQFPGARNWGYDGVYPFAVQNTYGGPVALKTLVNECHNHNLSVILDVVYNHLGPEGNYLPQFGPYFTDAYRTPWGKALNFDDAFSDKVRRFFIENALYWQRVFHIDALRLDAVHAIRDFSPVTFLEQLTMETQKQAEAIGRPFYLIGESDQNNPRLTLPREIGGTGLHAQWSDDLHHCLHAQLTGETTGYYADYTDFRLLAKTLTKGFAYTGEHSIYRKRRHGAQPLLNHPRNFVVCSQNHDQVGNRQTGDRPTASLSLESLKLAAVTVLLSPFTPLLFMGEEYGEKAPFQFFTSHTDPELVDAVRQGRRNEFASFQWKGETPDPQAEETFLRSKLNHELKSGGHGRALLGFYKELIHLRKTLPPLNDPERNPVQTECNSDQRIITVYYHSERADVFIILCFGETEVHTSLNIPKGRWLAVLDSAHEHRHGAGSSLNPEIHSPGAVKLDLNPCSAIILRRIN